MDGLSTIIVKGTLSASADSSTAYVPAPLEVADGPIEGTINGFPIRATVHTAQNGPSIEISKAVQQATGIQVGQPVVLEITRVDSEPEPRLPSDFMEALVASPPAFETWTQTTPNARRDWILFVTTSKQPETREHRIKRAVDQLGLGQRRVCCFGGLNWLTKDHPAAETWLPLQSAKKQSA